MAIKYNPNYCKLLLLLTIHKIIFHDVCQLLFCISEDTVYILLLLSSDHHDVRMVDGGSPCAGSAQVYQWGKWWTSAPYLTELKDLQDTLTVVGRETGCGPLQLVGGPEHFSYLQTSILISEHFCNGLESKVSDCENNYFIEAETLPKEILQFTYTGRDRIIQYWVTEVI